MKLPISVVIITLNEAQNIKRCIESAISWVDEVVVLDSGSVDQTLQICQQLGAKTIQNDWLGFGPQKRLATYHAKHNWVISLDADEAISEKLKIEILSVFQKLDEAKLYFFPRKSFFLGKEIRFGGWQPDYQGRLFNKKNHNWNENQIHEKVESKNVEYLQGPIFHWVFKDVAHQVQTNNRYSSLQATELYKQRKSSNLFKIIFKPFFKFLECYIYKLGFLDGFVGFVIAKNASYSCFLKWVKLYNLNKGIENVN